MFIRKGIFFLTLAVLVFSCRKGEDDPFLSFKSRTKRLCGSWKMVEYVEYHFEGVDESNYDVYEIRYKDEMCSIIYNGTVMEQYKITEDWEFIKDGSYKIETEGEDFSLVRSGKWFWNAKEKNSDYKKKECVCLCQTKYNLNNGEGIQESNGSPLSPSYVMALRLLSNKILIYDIEYSTYRNDSGYRRIRAEYKLEKVSKGGD